MRGGKEESVQVECDDRREYVRTTRSIASKELGGSFTLPDMSRTPARTVRYSRGQYSTVEVSTVRCSTEVYGVKRE
jgi:hypothetical protein